MNVDVNGAGDRSSLDELLEQCAIAAESGEDERALEMLLAAEPEHPDDPTLLCMLGELCRHRGSEGMATDFFRRCLAQEPTDPAILVAAGSALAATGDPEAEPALRLAALTAPASAPARMHFGAYLVRSGLADQGIDELQEARRLDPDDPAVLRELGIAHLLASHQVDAFEALEAAVALDPDDPDPRLLFGVSLLQAHEIERAAEELHPVSLALPLDTEVQLLLALVFGLAGWEEEAWLALSRAEAAPDPPDPAYLREVEEALEAGELVIRALLLTEIAPSFLRDRLYRI
jgi:predicted Zn-dependent protease